MTSRIDLKRAFLAALTAVAVAFALVLVAGGAPASADSPDSLPWESAMNQPSFWENYGATTHQEDDWVCVKDDEGSEGAFVLGNPPVGSVWRLLVVKAGSEINDLHWNPLPGDSFQHSIQRGWSHVTRCSRPIPDEVSPTSIVSTTTTIPDVVSPTSIVSTTVEVSVETLPFTGFESGTAGLLALALVASGALALVGTRVFRGETDE